MAGPSHSCGLDRVLLVGQLYATSSNDGSAASCHLRSLLGLGLAGDLFKQGVGLIRTARCREDGTTVVGGVTPDKGGTTHDDLPVWNTVAPDEQGEEPHAMPTTAKIASPSEAVEKEGADCALIFVRPAAHAVEKGVAGEYHRAHRAGGLHHRGRQDDSHVVGGGGGSTSSTGSDPSMGAFARS